MAWKEAGFEMIDFIVDLLPFLLEKVKNIVQDLKLGNIVFNKE
jgi:hypothetical protein